MTALDAYADDDLAALYDLVYDGETDDVPLYDQFARRADGPILELCAGSGRVTIPLAQAGHTSSPSTAPPRCSPACAPGSTKPPPRV